MRELILKMTMSFDGFVGGPDGSHSWGMQRDPEVVAWTLDIVRNVSLHIMGSRAFREMSSFWPTSTDVLAPPMNEIPKAVFSRKGPSPLEALDPSGALREAGAGAGQSAQLQPGAKSWAETYVARGDLAKEIADLKAKDGKPIIAYGGPTFARSLVTAGLVDQYCMLMQPIALGSGISIFSGLTSPRRLQLVSARAFPQGAVAHIYRPA
jgi:dihydrofolate reductase